MLKINQYIKKVVRILSRFINNSHSKSTYYDIFLIDIENTEFLCRVNLYHHQNRHKKIL